MNREIKYRAWMDGLKEMLDVDCISFKSGTVRVVHEKNKNASPIYDFTGVHAVKLMQFTGLKDKNGVEIYEGDVVEAKTVERSPIAHDYVSGYLKGVIEYYDNAFCIKYKDKNGRYIYNHLWINAEERYVLGNIHSHPHLLEETNENT